MTKRQRLTAATIANYRGQQQKIDRSDPIVAAFVADCGLASTPVAIKLTGESEKDVGIQIERLQAKFGSLVALTKAQRASDDITWIAHGTILA